MVLQSHSSNSFGARGSLSSHSSAWTSSIRPWIQKPALVLLLQVVDWQSEEFKKNCTMATSPILRSSLNLNFTPKMAKIHYIRLLGKQTFKLSLQMVLVKDLSQVTTLIFKWDPPTALFQLMPFKTLWQVFLGSTPPTSSITTTTQANMQRE